MNFSVHTKPWYEIITSIIAYSNNIHDRSKINGSSFKLNININKSLYRNIHNKQ